MSGQRLDWVILEVSCNLDDSVTSSAFSVTSKQVRSLEICSFNQQDVKRQSHHLGMGKATLLLAMEGGSHILVLAGAHGFPFYLYKHV